MKEHGDKLKDSDKTPLEAAIAKVREAAKGDDAATIKSAVGELEAGLARVEQGAVQSRRAAGAGPARPGGDAGAAAGGPCVTPTTTRSTRSSR